MNTIWNPSNPQVAGSEFYAGQSYGRPLAQAQLVGVALGSTLPESIAAVRSYFQLNAHGKLSSQFAQVGCDVYTDTLVDLFSPLRGVLVPVEVGVIGSGWLQAADYHVAGVAVTPSAYTFVGEPVGLTSPNTVALPSALSATMPATTTATFHGSTSVLDASTLAPVTIDPNSRRIQSVTVTAIVLNSSNQGASVDGVLNIGGAGDFPSGKPAFLNTGSPISRVEWTWAVNPSHLKPWVIQELGSFQAGLTNVHSFGVKVSGTGSGKVFVFAVDLTITYVTEHRVRMGFANVISGWNSFTMLDVRDGTQSPLPKLGGTQYQLYWYLTGDGGAVDLRHLDGANTDRLAALTGIAAISTPANPGGDGTPTNGIVTTDIATPTVVLDPGGATYSIDGQPYAKVQNITVDAANIATQRITTTGTLTYGGIAVIVGTKVGVSTDAPPAVPGGSAPQTAPLVVTLKLISNGNALGQVTIQPEEVAPDGNFHVLTRPFASAVALNAGGGYYLEYSSGSKPGWMVPLLDTEDSTNKTATLTIGGTSEYATYGPFGASRTDITGNIFVAPAAPTVPLSEPLTILNRPLFLSGCTPTTVGYAALSWTATTLGNHFAHYEVQRANPAVTFLGQPTWDTIAIVTLEASAYFSDFEGARNDTAFYRVRVVRTDGSPSAWLTFNSVTVPADVDVVTLASNVAADRSLAYQYESPEAWARTDATKVITRAISGRDLPVGFRGLELGGDTFTRTLIVAAADSVTAQGLIVGRDLFDPIAGLLGDPTLPYIAYCDGHSRRWLTVAQTGQMVRSEPGNSYKVDVTFTEVASVPTIVTTDIPWGAAIIPPPPPPPSLLFGDTAGRFGDTATTFGTR